jgi:hypothetical protein
MRSWRIRRASKPRGAPAFLWWLLLLPAASATIAGEADELLRRVPSDAGAVLIVERLAERSDAVLASPLVAAIREVPAVRAWLRSDQADDLRRSGRDLAAALGLESIDRLRTDLLGDAVVLSIHLEPGRPPDDARGLLLLRPRDRDRLERLIARINAIEVATGSLRKVEARSRKGVAYSVRRFEPGSKADEAYAILPGGAFAGSNSIALIEGVIDEVASRAWFRPIRAGLPADALVALAIDPRFVERLALNDPDSGDPGAVLVTRCLAAMDGWGAAVSWRDGPRIETIERYAPDRLAPEWKRWAARTGSADALLARVPSTAPVVAAGPIDLGAAVALLERLVPEGERPRFEALAIVASGLLMGRDPRREVLPALGPGAVAYVDASPETDRPPAVVAAIEMDPDADGLLPAIANASRTLLALAALDDMKKMRFLAHRRSDGVELMGLSRATTSGDDPMLAVAVAPDRLVLGSDPDAVASFLDGPGGFRKPAEVGEATSFVVIRIEAATTMARGREERVIDRLAATGRPREEVARDLNAVLELLAPFRMACATSRMTEDGAEARRMLSLLGRAGVAAP